MAFATRRRLLLLLVLACTVAALYLGLQLRPGATPAGQPPLLTLTAENLPAFAARFNAAPDAARVVLFYSPT